MSAAMGGSAANRQSSSRPPDKGSFPLDHFHECKKIMKGYLACMKANENAHSACREETKKYLDCRMVNGLMARENLSNFGLDDKIDYEASQRAQEEYVAARNSKYEAGWTAGMARAKGQGGIFKDRK